MWMGKQLLNERTATRFQHSLDAKLKYHMCDTSRLTERRHTFAGNWHTQWRNLCPFCWSQWIEDESCLKEGTCYKLQVYTCLVCNEGKSYLDTDGWLVLPSDIFKNGGCECRRRSEVIYLKWWSLKTYVCIPKRLIYSRQLLKYEKIDLRRPSWKMAANAFKGEIWDGPRSKYVCNDEI